jgi:hypothetical protein
MRMELRTLEVVSAAGRLYGIAGGERAWTFRAGIVPRRCGTTQDLYKERAGSGPDD